MKSGIWGAIAGIVFISAAQAQPIMMDQEPSHALECVFQHAERSDVRQRVTLFLFDEPMTIDRFSSVSGPQEVEGITAVSMVFGSSDELDSFGFGRHIETPNSFEVPFEFSSRINLSGLTFVPNPDLTFYIDRMAGTMRGSLDNPNAAVFTCDRFSGSFQDAADVYRGWFVDAVEQLEGQQKF